MIFLGCTCILYFLQIISNLQNNLQYIYWKKNLCVNRSMQSKPMLFKGQLYLNFHLKVCSHRWKQSQRDLSVMWKWRQLDIGRIWVFHLQSPWLLSAQTEAHTVCTVNAELVSLNSAWIRSKEHMCSALGSVLRWEYVQRLKAEPWGIWKVCDGKNGGRDSMSANFGKWR